MTEQEWDDGTPKVFKKTLGWIDRMLDSHESANALIILLIVLSILPILGIGILLTRAANPVHQVEVRN